jgi:hypothetical protein
VLCRAVLPPPQVCKEVQESHGKMLKDWIKGITGVWVGGGVAAVDLSRLHVACMKFSNFGLATTALRKAWPMAALDRLTA